MTYQHPLAYLIGMEGLACLRAWGGDYDEAFVRARLNEVRRLVEDEPLRNHPGVQVESGATAAAYRQWAATYDEPGNDLLELDLPFVDAVLDGLPSGLAVDTACGTGRLSRRLWRRGHRVLGVDGSPEMVEQARRSLPDVAFAVADLAALPLPDASVDLVTNALALTHVADLGPVLAEFARVLRPGGVAIVSDVHPELVFRGSTVKARGPAGQPQFATTHGHTVGDHLRAALAAGFLVRGFDELPRRRLGASSRPAAEPHRELGGWDDWPWTLLPWVPEASAAAWNEPAVLVYHLELKPYV